MKAPANKGAIVFLSRPEIFLQERRMEMTDQEQKKYAVPPRWFEYTQIHLLTSGTFLSGRIWNAAFHGILSLRREQQWRN
jgi:hypothetical protein